MFMRASSHCPTLGDMPGASLAEVMRKVDCSWRGGWWHSVASAHSTLARSGSVRVEARADSSKRMMLIQPGPASHTHTQSLRDYSGENLWLVLHECAHRGESGNCGLEC
eukprot:1083373-Pelagomonas_calceolata.AAC.5